MASSRKTATNEQISTYGASGMGRDFTSLSTWEALTDVDLVSAAESEVLEIYDDAVFDDEINMGGADCNSSYFRIIRPAGVKGQASWQGHDGTPNNGVKFISTVENSVLEIDEEYSQIQDIIAGHNINYGSTVRVFMIDDSDPNDGAALVGCIALGDGNAGSGAVSCFEIQPKNTGDTVFAINCIGIGGNRGFDADGVGDSILYNCTAIDNTSFGFREDDGTVTLINCLADNTGDDFDIAGGTTISYCASSDGTATGTGSRINQTFTFVNAGSDDYHLDENDAGAKGFGTDLSADGDYAFDDDIDWDTRPATWDIGFDQFIASGPENVADVNGILAANISDINGVTYSDINDINGID